MKVTQVLLLLVALVASGSGMAQWKAVASREKTADVLYEVGPGAGGKEMKNLYFPEYGLHDSLLTEGYSLLKTISVRRNLDSLHLGKKRITGWLGAIAPVTCLRDTTVLTQRIFLRNVSHYVIYLRLSGEQKWYKKQFEVAYEGYQVPIVTPLSAWVGVRKDTEGLFAASPHPRQVDLILIEVTPRTASKRAEFIAGQLALCNQVRERFEVQHPFFDKLLSKPGNSDSLLTKDCFSVQRGLPLLLANEPYYRSDRMSSQISLMPAGPETDELALLRALIGLAVEKYPFYGERKIDKTAMRKEAARLAGQFRDTCALLDYAGEVARFVGKEFRDGHFRVDVPDKATKGKPGPAAKVRGPVRLFEIDNQLYVAAVLDSLYRTALPLGSKVLAIDGVPAAHWLDSSFLAQSPGDKREGVSKLLEKSKADSTRITFRARGSSHPGEITIRYNRRMEIPANFAPKHCDFRSFDGSISYFRLNQWTLDVYLRLLNYWQEHGLEKANGLIIDLRGNGGGDGVSVVRLMSLFVSSPSVLTHCFPAGGNGSEYESLVVRPNPSYQYPAKKPVVILVDEMTACASESFILGMKKYTNCTVIGTSRTMGALASRTDVTLPSGIVLVLDCIMNKEYFGEGVTVEEVGIAPDLWVRRRQVEDLAPYNDKVLQVAVKYLQAPSWSKKNR
jgi:C-terminal processing protease CtpA/Prc